MRIKLYSTCRVLRTVFMISIGLEWPGGGLTSSWGTSSDPPGGSKAKRVLEFSKEAQWDTFKNSGRETEGHRTVPGCSFTMWGVGWEQKEPVATCWLWDLLTEESSQAMMHEISSQGVWGWLGPRHEAMWPEEARTFNFSCLIYGGAAAQLGSGSFLK